MQHLISPIGRSPEVNCLNRPRPESPSVVVMHISAHLWSKRLAATCALGVLVWAGSNSVTASELYRWQDANGNPVISDRPPPSGTPYTTLNGSKYGMKGRRASVRPLPPSTASQARPATSKEQAPKIIEVPAVRDPDPSKCEAAKENQFKLSNFPRIRVQEDNGVVRFLSREEIQTQIETANRAIERYCE